ncbi:MAG: glycosyl transferase family 1, partial [Bacteroidales bacterium]|nr:glycosyl transferase family 1 [Bacteroidales bacterium]
SLFIRANFFIPDPRCWWVRPSVRFLKSYLKEHPVDAIVTTGPPQSMHMIGLKLSEATNLPWMPDFRDPWTKMYYYKNLPFTHYADARQHSMEKAVLDNANVVLTVTPFMQADFASMTSTPVEVITNGYDENDFNQIVESDGNFNITHTGLFSSDGNPEILWSVLAEKCSRDPEFKKMLRIRLIGRTDDAIVSSVARAGLKDNLLNFGYKSHSTAIKEQKSASMLILPLRNDPDYKPILPGKLFEYIASGRPILGIGQEDGATADVLRETKAGEMCGWLDSSAISRYIDTCWDRFKSGETYAVSDKISMYSRRSLTGRLAELLNSITEKHE